MDISRAFSYVFDDPEWVKKILIGGLISLIPFVGGFFVYGYMLEIARRIHATGEEGLPEWDDLGGYLTHGFLFWLGLMIWTAPIYIILGCGIGAAILVGALSGELAVFWVMFALAMLVFMPVMMVFSLVSAFLSPVLIGRYANRRHFGAMFEFDEIVADLRTLGWMSILFLVLTTMAAGAIGQLGIVLCFVGVIFTGFYGNLAIAHIAGQAYRVVHGNEDAQVLESGSI